MKIRTQSNLHETDSLIREIENHARQLRKVRGVKIGYFGKQATTAAITEFGRKNVPARPFMREAAQASQEAVANAMREYPDDPQGAIKKVGRTVKAAIKKEIKAGESAVLAESKRERKGHADMLRDSGELERSVKVKITR